MHELAGTTTLIVGGSSGIGRATARPFVYRGGAVIVAARRQERRDRAAAELGTAARGLALDVTDGLQLGQAVDALPEEGIDHLVITAATLAHGPFATHTVEEVRAMFDSKFWGAYAVTRAVLPKLRDGGAVVFVSGVLSRRPGMNCAALGAACAALEALARGLALELGPRIRVNCIAPGMVRTELHDRLPEERREAAFATTGASLPVRRVGRPEEVAQAILLAATNGYLPGAVIDVDGGHMVRQYARS
jgi:NAD(P)-dependent dehydrogenase (short-subunit alcohol dehydrogenase family)